jgi:hypothetical protein
MEHGPHGDKAPPTEMLGTIVALLNKHRQRATYGAVGAVIGSRPLSVMDGRRHSQAHSWVVSKRTGTPTGYRAGDMHPSLQDRKQIISTEQELLSWLAKPE